MLYPVFREKSTSQHVVGRVCGGSPASVSGPSRLMRLPNELLVQIWTYMSRIDVESMSLVNRHIHNLGCQYIQEHRRLKQRYLRVENALPYGHELRMAERKSALYLVLSPGMMRVIRRAILDLSTACSTTPVWLFLLIARYHQHHRGSSSAIL